MLTTPACLLDEHGEVSESSSHLLGIEKVQPRDEDRSLHDRMRATVKPCERPLLMFGHHARLEPQTFTGVVYGRHCKLERAARRRQDKPNHPFSRPHLRLTRFARHHAGQEEHIITDMEDAGPCPEEVDGRLARRERTKHEAAEVPRDAFILLHAGPHRRDMRLARGVHGGNEPFEDHAGIMIK